MILILKSDRMRRVILLVTILLYRFPVNAGLKSFIVAVPVENIDCTNLIGSSTDDGKITEAVNAVNYATQQGYRSGLKFFPEQLLHMTLVYVGSVDDTYSNYDDLLKDLKRFFRTIAEGWMQKRQDKTVIKSSLTQLLWPPLGKKGSWLSYGVSMSKAGAKDLLAFTNSMRTGVSNLIYFYGNALKNAQGVSISRETISPLDALDLHVSLGRFNKGYSVDPQGVFGVPTAFKEMIDTKFQALPVPLQPNFDVNELVLYMKNEQHQVQILEKFSLKSEDTLTQ